MIDVRQLSFTYPGAGRPALEGVSFAIAPGEVVGFLGPSGAGKSTLQKILIGLLRGYTGDIHVLGRPLTEWKADYYERIGVSFELPNHYQKLTARENLNFFRQLYSGSTEDPDRLLAAVGLTEDADTRVSQFSKGMQMRLTFCRALLNRPELIFLDEPTSGLDPGNARRVKEMIRELQAEGRTILLTTHNMAVADELCDRVAFIVDGRLVRLDAPRALKLAGGERRVQVTYRAGAGLETRDFPLDRLADQAAFLALLRTGTVETIHTQEATLEDVFLQVTGRNLA